MWAQFGHSLAAFMDAVASPTVRQIYALAAELCERMGEEFPETREAASATIERLRIENGHPAPLLEQTAPRRLLRKRGGRERHASEVAARIVDEMT
jgi:hypothetical protein